MAPGHTVAAPVGTLGFAGILLMLIHLAGLVDEPPHARAAVTQSWPDTNAGGKVTCTFGDPCPDVMGTEDPPSVQL